MSDSMKTTRWLVVVGALLIQLCLGAIYAWGLFTPTLQADKAKLATTYSAELLGITAEKQADLKTRYSAHEDKIKELTAACKALPADDPTLADKEAEITKLDEEFNEKFLADAGVSDDVWAKHHFGFTSTQTSMIFSAGLLTFALVMIAAGRWQDKVGPRLVALIGGVVLAAGYLGASFTGTAFWPMFVLVGVVGGAGIGLGYVCPIAACVKWFPDLKGFITGMAVAGFGAGAFIFVKLGGAWGGLIASGGVNYTFMVFGIIFAAGVILGALLLSNPPAGWKPAGWYPPEPKAGTASAAAVDLTQGECVKTAQFWMIWLAFVFSAGCGLMVIKCVKAFGQLEGGLTAAEAGTALGLLALFNGLGRIVWGTASQYLTARRALALMTLLQGGMMFVLLGMGGSVMTLGLAACWLGFNFGGNFALFPLLTAENFGTKNLGGNYGAVFTAYGVGGVLGPMLAGGVWDTLGSFKWAFIPAGIACLLATGLALMLKPPHK